MGYIETLLGKNEQIVFKTRQHWMVLAKSFLVNLVLLMIFVVLSVAASLVLPVVGLSATVLFLVPIIAFTRDYLAWWNEEYLVTNRRIIQIEGVINKHVIDSSIEKINDVVLDQSFLGRLLDFGNLEILTASEIGVNKLHHLASPVRFKTEMLNQRERQVSETPAPAHHAPNDIPALIAELDELRKQGVLTEDEFLQKKAQLLAKM